MVYSQVASRKAVVCCLSDCHHQFLKLQIYQLLFGLLGMENYIESVIWVKLVYFFIRPMAPSQAKLTIIASCIMVCEYPEL